MFQVGSAPGSSGPKTFSNLGCLSAETVDVLTSLGFHTTTPVQEATIPLFCGHKDVAVDACTGSGKTLAFVLPVIEHLRRLDEPLRLHQVGAIIISPTRELAKQIYGVAEPFIASVPQLTSMLLVGGRDPAQDVAALKARGAHVLVGTPGRIEDILKRCSAMDLRRLEVLVLDEADRLLDMGFKVQLDAVMARLPKQRRTGLFSATQTEAVQELARAGLRNPVRVNVAINVAAAPVPAPATQPPQQQQQEQQQQQQQQQQPSLVGKKRKGKGEDTAGAATAAQVELATGLEGAAVGSEVASQKTPNSLSIQYVICEADEKITQLVRFLRLYGPSCKVIVYAMTCAAVDYLALVLPRLPQLRGVRLRALHGRMKQVARERELEAFRQLPAGALLCTDLAARGLDIPDVHWIVQLDPPQDPAAFVHRVGRTARMGRQGNAAVYLQPHEEAYVEFLTLRKIPITEGTQLPPTDIPINGAAPTEAANSKKENNGHILHKSKKQKHSKQESAAGQGMTSAAGTHKPDAPSAGGCLASSSLSEVLSALRSAAERDREVMERATKAFVTYVRGYKEHHCKFIFRLQDLNVGRLATGLGLLRLPKMPDLKKPLGLEHFTPSSVDPATVPYKDKNREKQRIKTLQQRQEAAAAKGGVAGQGGAASTAKRKPPAGDAAFEPRLPAAKRRQLQQIDEMAKLNAEYSLLKKVKKGKITEHQYDVATGLSSESEADDEPDEGRGLATAAPQRGGTRTASGKERGPAGGDHGSDDAEDVDESDVEVEDRENGAGPDQSYCQGGAKPGASDGGSKGLQGVRGGRGQQLIGVRLLPSALQSYMDKKAKKSKKKKKKTKQQQAGADL
ncbi:hypothetical protein VaNZ11_005533 [Volvox africanus]|uniref:ATP-dependent RNA helicase n=1 Tax=Volvox africanus TaxID=51714 RepID=A0ABQ5RZE7_9CHLO|nr:hypothetical protein VaNZ11_005533 [Volvox africanus]